MAPIKFEEQIKDKLEKRTVTPSSQAWSQLSDRLDADQKQKRNPLFWWFGIAASVAVMVLVSITYLSKITDATKQNTIVKDKKEEVISPKASEVLNFELEVGISKSEKETTNTEKEIIKTNKVKTKKNTVAAVEKDDFKVTEAKESEAIETDIVKLPSQNEFNTIIAELNTIKEDSKNQAIDKEIDSLLKWANKAILKDKILKNNTGIVDANSLLQDVEEEMGTSFRTQIYNALKDNYKRIKTAVAQRND